jgi:hypothetical protein
MTVVAQKPGLGLESIVEMKFLIKKMREDEEIERDEGEETALPHEEMKALTKPTMNQS